MMKTILKFLFIGLSVLLAVLVVFGIVLVLNWPWWVGFFILLLLVGVGIGVYLLMQVLARKREQRFVSQIIEQDEAQLRSLKEDERTQFTELQARFREAVAALKGSHLKKQGNPLYVLPWYMVIGESASGKTTAIKSARLSSPFAEMTQVSGFSGTKNCDWWFFEQAVIIDTAGRYAIPVDEGRDKEEWQRFLNLLAKYRKKEPLNGLVVAVAADRLLDGSPEDLQEDGKQIRRRIDELMRVLGSRFPVYLLVTKCDLVQGMTQFTAQLDDELLQQAFGAVNHDLSQDYPGFLARAMHTIAERLAGLRLLILHKIDARSLDPAMLLFPEEFSRLKAGIESFTKGAFLVNPYQETPMLRGIFFTSGRQEGTPYSHFLKALNLIEDREVLPGTNKGLFLHDFFARILPRERGLFAPTRQAMAWERLTLNLGLLAWVAIGIALCGILSFSFVKNLGIIRSVPMEFSRPITLKGDMNADLALMEGYRSSIIKVQERNSSWWIPRLGLSESRDAELQFKHNFCRLFDERFLSLYDHQISVDIKGAVPADARLGEYIVYLVRRINLLKARLNDDDLTPFLSKPMPLLASTGQSPEGAKQFMGLYTSRLMWEGSDDVLKKESSDLQALLVEAMDKTPDFRWITTWINGGSTVQGFSLKTFWGGSVSAAEEIKVEPACTVEGKAQIDAFLVDLESALPNPGIAGAKKSQFLGWYRDTYREAWHSFAMNFDKGTERLRGDADWKAAASKAASRTGLYFGLLKIMAEQLRPVNQDPLPDWMRFVFEFQREQELSVKLESGTIAKATETASKLREKIQQKIGTESTLDEAGQEYQSARALLEYVVALNKINGIVTKSRASAFQAGSAAFSEDPSASPFSIAQNAVRRVSAGSGTPSEALWKLAYGPVDFFWAYTCQQSACYLQEIWEKEVLVNVQGIADPGQLTGLLFSPDGLATKFIKGPAAPFVGRDLKRGYYGKEAFGRSLPFEPAFLSFFSKAKVGLPMAAMAPAGGGDNAVTISGMPTEANDGAKSQPHTTRLTLQCMDGQQQLVNMNYPVTKTVTWSSQRCGSVIFTIEVGNLVLTKNYSGPESFAKFLMDFPGGRHTFSPDDFPREAAQLRAMGIRFIKVQYRFSGHEAVINQAKPTMEQPTAVPQTIVRCMAR